MTTATTLVQLQTALTTAQAALKTGIATAAAAGAALPALEKAVVSAQNALSVFQEQQLLLAHAANNTSTHSSHT